jgi:hypothetical protein
VGRGVTATPGAAPGAAPESTASGPGRVLVAVYGVFALAATARAGYQLIAKFDEAPLAYLLSALAALVYVVATVALARDRRGAAWAAVGVELVGVLAVGTLSVLDPGDLPDATVWSGFGEGYGYVPLVLPFLGVAWLWHTRPRGAAASAADERSRPAASPDQ